MEESHPTATHKDAHMQRENSSQGDKEHVIPGTKRTEGADVTTKANKDPKTSKFIGTKEHKCGQEGLRRYGSVNSTPLAQILSSVFDEANAEVLDLEMRFLSLAESMNARHPHQRCDKEG